MIWPRLAQDVRGGLRFLRAEPSQSVTIVAVLALGIGASLAVFGIVDLTLVRPLPYPGGDRLVVVRMQDRRASQDIEFTSYPVYDEWKRHNSNFAGLTAFLLSDATLTGSDRPELVQTAQVESDFFPLLGSAPLMGRRLESSDTTPGNDGVVVLSHRLWISRYGGASDVLSKDMWLDGRRHTIVGVMPQAFEFPNAEVDLWRPLVVGPGMKAAPLAFWASVAGRLTPTASPETARAELSSLLAGLAKRNSGLERYHVLVRTLRAVKAGDTKQALLLLQAVIGVFAIAYRAVTARGRELGLRLALGAQPWSLIWLVVWEGMRPALVGVVFGVLTALAASSALSSLLYGVAASDLPTLAAVGGGMTAIVVVACLGAARRAARIDPSEALRSL